MTRTWRYAVAVGIGLVAGFYVGARSTTMVLKDRMRMILKDRMSEERPLTMSDQLAQIRRNLEEYQATLNDDEQAPRSNEWFEDHPIVQRLEREEAEADARASGKVPSVDAVREQIRPTKAGDTTLEELHRRSKPGGV